MFDHQDRFQSPSDCHYIYLSFSPQYYTHVELRKVPPELHRNLMYFIWIVLINLLPMHLFSSPWKHLKTIRFFDGFRGKRKDALETNGIGFNILWRGNIRNATILSMAKTKALSQIIADTRIQFTYHFLHLPENRHARIAFHWVPKFRKQSRGTPKKT